MGLPDREQVKRFIENLPENDLLNLGKSLQKAVDQMAGDVAVLSVSSHADWPNLQTHYQQLQAFHQSFL